MKKKIILLTLLILIFLYFTSYLTIGRYIYNAINNYILESKGFYFNSTVLNVNNAAYSINNWDGVNSYTLTIDVNNKKNENLYTEDSYKKYADIYADGILYRKYRSAFEPLCGHYPDGGNKSSTYDE